MSQSSVPDELRTVRRLPDDEDAARRVLAWTRHEPPYFVPRMDLRGADFTGSRFGRCYLIECNLRGVCLAGAKMDRTDLGLSDLSGADLTGASLFKAEVDRTILVEAILDRVYLVRAEFWKVDATRASFVCANLGGAMLMGVDARGASFDAVELLQTAFACTVDSETTFDGMSGSLFGPMAVMDGDRATVLDGDELQEFLRRRGADVEVLKPARPSSVEFYPPINALGQS